MQWLLFALLSRGGLNDPLLLLFSSRVEYTVGSESADASCFVHALEVLQAQGVDCLDFPERDTEDRRGCGKRDKVIVLQPFVWRRAK